MAITLITFGCIDTTNAPDTEEIQIFEDISWCSVKTWSSGDYKEIYTTNQFAVSNSDWTKIFNISIDSIKGDTTFISNETIESIVVHKSYYEIDEILEYNYDYYRELEYYGGGELYHWGDDFIRCKE